jgi:hypothetical protein
MKMNKHFSQPQESFFSRQAEEIASRTTDLESWKLAQAGGRAEDCFPVSEGYWLTMEEGIRQKIEKPQSVWSLSLITWKPALATLVILLAFGIGFRLSLNKPENKAMALEKVEQLKEDEIMLYLTEQTESGEVENQFVLQNVPVSIPDLPLDYNAEELLEESNLNETDFESSL